MKRNILQNTILFFQVDFERYFKMTAVVTKGLKHDGYKAYVKKYVVKYGNSSNSLRRYNMVSRSILISYFELNGKLF